MISYQIEKELLLRIVIPRQPLEEKLGVTSLHAVQPCRRTCAIIEALSGAKKCGGINKIGFQRYAGMFLKLGGDKMSLLPGRLVSVLLSCATHSRSVRVAEVRESSRSWQHNGK